MDLAFLAAIDEWAAYGYYEGEGLPYPRAYGLAYRRMYEHMPVDVPAGACLIPAEPLYHGKNNDQKEHHCVNAILNLFHSDGLEVRRDIAAEKQARYPQHRETIDGLCTALEQAFPSRSEYIHSNPDILTVVGQGFDGMCAQLEGEITAAERDGDVNSRPFLLALRDYAAGVAAYWETARRAVSGAAAAAEGVRRAELVQIEAAMERAFRQPAETFLEGLLGVYFTWLLDGCDSLGRLDYALGALYERDIRDGRLDAAFAERLIDELFQRFEQMNGWNLQLGGAGPDGRDVGNDLTRALLRACRRNRQRRPNVALRLNEQTPPDIRDLALESLAAGSGRPALYNDTAYIRLLQETFPGMPYADAVLLGFGGCTETMIAGLSCVDSLAGNINLARALVLALFDGIDPLTGERAGPATGMFAEMETYGAFTAALRRQIEVMTAAFVQEHNAAIARRAAQGDPKMARSFFTRDCVHNRRSFEAGGARYNWAVVSYDGTTVLIDSLTAVREWVYERREISRQTLLAALRADFRGYEAVRGQLRAAPKFGNGDAAADAAGVAVIREAWACLRQYHIPRGDGSGRYLPSVIEFATYDQAGLQVAATPDGRRAREPLNDSIGAVAGNDRRGPTALLASVLALPLSLAVGTPVLNLRFHKSLLASVTGRGKAGKLLETYFRRGGLQAQISVVDAAELRAAQRDPAAYRDLIVRIGGYSEYFVNLTPALQQTVIERTTYA